MNCKDVIYYTDEDKRDVIGASCELKIINY